MIKYLFIFLFCCNAIFAHQYSEQEIGVMKNIRCPICNGQSIYDSNNEISLELRKIVVELCSQHKSSTEIEEIFVEKFGPDILVNKPHSINYLLYAIPLVALVIISLALVRKYIKHKICTK
jgi:cytochrome c-type biogenesis protein CcmH